VQGRLKRAADRLVHRFETTWRPGPLWHLSRRIDRLVLSRFLFAKDPEQYAHVIRCFRQRGWMK
jgi:hypothetical protein